MTPWEAVHERFGIDERAFRESRNEQRELIAFWVEGSQVGRHGVRGIDHWAAGGIDEIVDLNGRFLRAFLDCIEADQVGGKDEGPFILAKIVAECSFRGTRQLRRDREGVIHPARKFKKWYGDIADPLQVQSLSPLLTCILDCDAVAFDRQPALRGVPLWEPQWSNVFVWIRDPVEAGRHIEARISEASEVLATWVVKS